MNPGSNMSERRKAGENSRSFVTQRGKSGEPED